MKYLPDNLVAYQCDYETYSQYVIMIKESEDENKIYGPGIEATVNYPRSEYTIYSDYDMGDSGWERMFSLSKFIHKYGESTGVGVRENQLPLFNLFQMFSVWRNVHAQTYFRKYVPCIIGITYLDMIYRFNSQTVVDSSLSKSVIRLIDGFHETKMSPAPVKIKINDRDETFNYDNYTVSVEKNICKEISENFLNFGELGFRYEMSRLSKDPVDLESPRWWRQKEIEKLDLKDIIYDNQIVLF